MGGCNSEGSCTCYNGSDQLDCSEESSSITKADQKDKELSLLDIALISGCSLAALLLFILFIIVFRKYKKREGYDTIS